MTRPRRLGDGGEATTQLVILTPVVLLLVLLVIQAALLFYVAHVAEAAAARGADAAALADGSADDGVAAIQRFLDGVATTARAPRVSRDHGQARAEVALRVPHVVPFFPSEITRVSSRPVERFVAPSDR